MYKKVLESPYIDDKVDTEVRPWQLGGVFVGKNEDFVPIHAHGSLTYLPHISLKCTHY